MNRLNMVAAAGSALVLSIVVAVAQGSDGKLGARSIPAALESYADPPLVMQNARRVIDLMGTATFTAPASDEQENDSVCNSEAVQSFVRGYLLAHSAFNMFLALQEGGFTDIAGPNGLPHIKHRRFVQFGRSALLGAWTPKQLAQLLEVRRSLTSLPPITKADVAAFLTKLQEYRTHYTRLKAVNPDLLEDLFRRESDDYYWYRAYLERAGPDAAEVLKGIPEGIGYEGLSEQLDKRLRAVSDVAKEDPHACFVHQSGPVLAFPTEKLKRDYTEIFATKYMVSFWRRRDLEGTSAMADYVIGRVLDALQKKAD